MATDGTAQPQGGVRPPPPIPSQDTNQNSPLGVPLNFHAPYGLRAGSTDFMPGSPMVDMFPGVKNAHKINTFGGDYRSEQYMPGDQWAPQSDPETVPDLQRALIAAGYLNPKSVRLGVWDPDSANAYARVLGFANSFGGTAQQALQILISNPKASATTDTFVDPVFTNPQDVQTGFQNISQNLTGQEQDPAAFQQAFHAQEAATGHQSGSSYTQAPSITGAATQYLQQHDPSQIQAYGAASRMLELESMLGVR